MISVFVVLVIYLSNLMPFFVFHSFNFINKYLKIEGIKKRGIDETQEMANLGISFRHAEKER